MKLTKQQRQIIDDYELLAAPLKIDVDQLSDDTADRTLRLQFIFHEWVRGMVIMRYTLIDEYLACIIANYMFGKPKTWHYRQKWRTKKFQRFNHYVLDELYLLKKQDFVHAIKPLPSDIRSKIMQINDVRNAMAHSFFPQNRRRPEIKSRRIGPPPRVGLASRPGDAVVVGVGWAGDVITGAGQVRK